MNGKSCLGNLGCGINDTRSSSFGDEFNANQGGVFAMV